MHEVGLISNILDMVRDDAACRNISRIKKIHLLIGKFSMVLPDSMQFAFEALRDGEYLFQDALLYIEEKDLECLCNDCKHSFTIVDYHDFTCPHCSCADVQITAGRELSILSYEGE